MPTTTTNYSFYKPLVNDPTDEDLWGGYLNDNSDSLDSLLKTASDFVTRAVSTTPVSTSVSDRNKVILVDATAASATINLLAAATAGDGFTVVVKKTDSSANTVTIDGNASETIDGAATYIISTQYDSVVLVSNGSNWSIVADVKTVLLVRGAQAILTGSGNFTTPSNTTLSTMFKFTLTGGGGGGAGASGVRGGGGGAATTAIYYATGLSASQTCAYSVGAGGAGGTAGNNGADGSDTTITVGATTVTAPKGIGALAGINEDGGSGGAAATNATLSIQGGGGGSPATQGNADFSGFGGSSFWGGGGQAVGTNGGTVGIDGKAYGAGGSGGNAGAGGNGASGVILVEWY